MRDESPSVVALISDMLDRSRIQGVAKAVGTSVAFADSVDELPIHAETSAVLIDLDDEKLKPIEAIERLHNEHVKPRLIGYVSHVDQAARERAEAAGCDEVLTRAAFFRRLSVLLAETGGKR